MSWFHPPPVVEKPLPPGTNFRKPPRFWFVYAFGVGGWIVVFQVLGFIGLVLRFLLLKPPTFLPRTFVLWEMMTVGAGFLVGHFTTMRILFLALRYGKPEKTPQP